MRYELSCFRPFKWGFPALGAARWRLALRGAPLLA